MVDYDTTITTRITEETKEQIEKYAEDNGLSKAGAYRQLLYKGMRVEGVEKGTELRRAGQSGNLFEIIQTTLLIAILAYLIIGAI